MAIATRDEHNRTSFDAQVENGPVMYCSAKVSLTAYVRSMGCFLSREGIIVMAVLPGSVFTEGGVLGSRFQ